MNNQPPWLDELTATLARTRPPLDEETDRRVAARLTERLDGASSPATKWPRFQVKRLMRLLPSTARERRFALGGFAVALSVIAVVVLLDGTEPEEVVTSAQLVMAGPLGGSHAPVSAAAPPAPLHGAAPERDERESQAIEQASLSWPEAMASPDPEVRRAAASVLGDLVDEEQAMPWLATAISDSAVEVRLAASRSASKMKSKEAALQVVAAVRLEGVEDVVEAQLTALGEIGQPEAGDVLRELLHRKGRLGVLAAGALIAVGDVSGHAVLAAAASSPALELRLAAVQAASRAKNPIVVPVLAARVRDPDLEVRFTAAEGLLLFKAEQEAAMAVMQEGRGSRDSRLVDRAMIAMLRMEVGAPDTHVRQALESLDPKRRLAAVPMVQAMPRGKGASLLQQLLRDEDREVRRAAVTAIVSIEDRDTAWRMYQVALEDGDVVVRARATGQMARRQEASVEITRSSTSATEAPPAAAWPSPPPAARPAVPLGEYYKAQLHGEISTLLVTARMDLYLGAPDSAENKLAKATRMLQAEGRRTPIEIEDLYAQLYEQKADSPFGYLSRRGFLQQARIHSQRVIERGVGRMASDATRRIKRLDEALAQSPEADWP
jgi:HEAT repeat protein